MATRNYSVIGDNNFIGVNCDGVVLHNSNDCIVQPFTNNVTLINCDGLEVSPKDNGKVFINNSIAQGNRSTSITGSAPAFVTGAYNIYYVDSSLGSAIAVLDAAVLKDKIIYFKMLDDTNGLFFQTITNSETIDNNALPFDTMLNDMDCITITSDGANFWII
jgi:hypothetical protein